MKLFLLNLKTNKSIQKLIPLWLAILFGLALSPYYIGTSIILGGEANYLLNYSSQLYMLQHQWVDRFGTGLPNFSTNGAGLQLYILSLLENYSENKTIPNFLLVFSLYYLPALGMYLALSELKIKPSLTFTISIFYVVNPFTMSWMSMLNQWNNFAAAAMPFLFWIIIKNYKNNLRLFLFYGLLSSFFSQAYTNVPLNIVINLSAIISILFASYHYYRNFQLKHLVAKILLINLSFMLFNAWWWMPLSYFVGDAQRIYSESFAEEWLTITLNEVSAPLTKGLLFNLITPPENFDFLGYWHNTLIGQLLSIIPIVIVLIIVLKLSFFSKHKSAAFLTSLIFLGTLFLIKGSMPPFGDVYMFLFKYFPFFSVFKTPFVKFGLLYYFLFSLLLGILLNNAKAIKSISLTSCFNVYLLFCLIPIFSGNIIPEAELKNVGKVTRKFSDSPIYISARAPINNSKLNARSLSIPGMGNYQLLIKNGEKKHYSGVDPLLANTNKPWIIGYQNRVIYNNFLSMDIFSLIGFFNVGRLVMNEESIPWFGFVGPNYQDIKIRLQGTDRKTYGNIIIWENMKFFKPLIQSSISPWMILRNKSYAKKN